MTLLTDTQVISASGGLVELAYMPLGTTGGTITAGTNAYVGGTATAVCDGSPVIVECIIPRVDVQAGGDMYVDFEVDGTSYGRIGNIYNPGTQIDAETLYMNQRLTPSAGVHTFRVRAYATGATTNIITGDGSNYAALAQGFLRISKVVQATQWPAVTTGTIICTSTTRPSSPFAGQKIYETDTSRYWTYSTWSQWVPDDMVFATEAARDTAIPSANATEGMRAYITSPTVTAPTGATYATLPTGITTIYNGSAWVCTTPITALSTVSATTTSGSYVTTLTGDGTAVSVTCATGTTANIAFTTKVSSALAGRASFVGLSVSGATTIAAGSAGVSAVAESYGVSANMINAVCMVTGLTAGNNTFTLNYSTGGSTTATWTYRSLTVQGIA